MSIALTGTYGLFTRLGKLAKLLYDVNSYQSSTIPTDITALIGQYTSTDQVLIDSINQQQVSGQSAALGLAFFVQNMSQQVLLKMVYDDTGFFQSDLSGALGELIRQMRASTDSVLGYTVSGTVSATNV